MGDKPKRANTEERKPVRMAYVTDSYDKVPQPKGEFKDLFQAMQKKSNANTQRAAENDKSSR